ASYSALQFGGQSRSLPTSEPESAREDQLYEASQDQPAEPAPASLPAASSHDDFMHRFPRGSSWGIFLHGLLEWAASAQGESEGCRHLRGFAAAVADDQARNALIQ